MGGFADAVAAVDSRKRSTQGRTTNGVTVFTTALAAAHWAGPWGFGFPWFLIFIPLFWILVVVLIVAFAGRRWRRAAAASYGPRGWGYDGSHGARSAESTLAERFAQGDIDEVEYRARLEVLRANRPTP